MSEERPFQIRVLDEDLQRLKSKLELVILPDELEDSGHAYGVPLADVQRLLARWKSDYDWRTHEARLNQTLPQFSRPIDTPDHGSLSIHYVHQKSPRVNAIPLLFVHGWPGSFLEVSKILRPLTNPENPEEPAFHVVAPSLPGFGFSEAPKKKGFGITHYAEVCHRLMLALGYNQYVTQGGDWGHWITRKLASIHGGKHVKAWHTNYPFAEEPTFFSSPLAYLTYMLTPYTDLDRRGVERRRQFSKEEQGYSIQQGTRPQTLGYALTDSPVGLLAWIYEKLVSWSDNYPWDDDEVLTWVSIYVFSKGGPAASLRIYYEADRVGDRTIPPSQVSTIPMGASFFPKEIHWAPRSWTKASSGNLVFETVHDKGGHFAAYEQPEELVKVLRSFCGRGGKAFGLVDGKAGYD